MIPVGRVDRAMPTRPAVPRQRTDPPGRGDGTRAGSVLLAPHLRFRGGQARAALELYRSVLGGELVVATYGDTGAEGPLAALVRHGRLVTPFGMTLTAADAPEAARVTIGDNVSLSLSGGPEGGDVLRCWFAALSAGGEVRRPLALAPWGGELGMFVDRFGISWVVDIACAPTA